MTAWGWWALLALLLVAGIVFALTLLVLELGAIRSATPA